MSLKEDAEWLWSKACFLSIQDMKSYGNFRGFFWLQDRSKSQ